MRLWAWADLALRESGGSETAIILESIMKTLEQISNERVDLVKKAQQLNDKATTEKRSMSSEETEQFEKIMKDVDTLGTERDALIATEKRQNWLKQQGEAHGRRTEPVDPGGGGTEKREMRWGEKFTSERCLPFDDQRDTPEYRAATMTYWRSGINGLNGNEARALSAGTSSEGGFLLPVASAGQLIKFVDNEVFIRQNATVFQGNGAKSFGAPSLENDIDDADWTSELGTGNEDNAMVFGKRELTPHPLAKRIKVSNRLLNGPIINVEQLVLQRLAYKHAIAQEKAFLVGSGVNQPLGLFTAHASGISTGRDVSLDNTTTAITADNLMNVKYSLKSQYQAVASWLFHRDAIRNIRKLKDAENRYIWSAGLSGQPDTILDRPFFMSEYVPNTFTTGQYVGLFGDLSKYWIVDNLNVTVQRLVELYAATNQIGFIARLETDGMPSIEEAFTRIKLG